MANASGRCQGRHDRAKPDSRKGEAIYGSLALKHDPEKCDAAFRKDHAQTTT
jgi:hypothetical protein